MIPEFKDIEERQSWLVKNNHLVIRAKKSALKKADGFVYNGLFVVDKNDKVSKAEVGSIPPDTTKLKVRSIINTCNLYDSHGDVHIEQLWNKSLKENTENYLVNQHDFSFEGVISNDVKAFAKRYDWKDLGFHYKGDTQALVYDSIIDLNDPSWTVSAPKGFNWYKSGVVKQHSVGMMYVNLFLCLNNPAYKEYYDNWEKYKDVVVNLEDAEEQGYMYAVTAAKNIEGSPVLRGSNFATPTQSVAAAKNTAEDIDDDPQKTIAEEQNKFFYNSNLY